VIRFHLDEHVDHDIARGLRLRGIDVTTSTDADLLRAGDDRQLDFAFREQRVLVTHDADFLVLASLSTPHMGIVFAAMGTRTVGELVRHLYLMHDCMTEQEMVGRVEFA
jgi:predicted nuclease of predicted toxin-antitoxin system